MSNFGTDWRHFGTDCGTDCAHKNPNDYNKKGRVGQVGTDYHQNQANVRAISGNGQKRPDVSQSVPLVWEKG